MFMEDKKKQRRKPKPRSTEVETKHRIDSVYKLLAEGQSRTQIVQFVCEKWGVTDRTADNYMRDARKLLLADCEMERPAWIAEALQRLRVIEQKAMAKNQPASAINAINLQAKLIGIEL
jgi:hypothetical protein